VLTSPSTRSTGTFYFSHVRSFSVFGCCSQVTQGNDFRKHTKGSDVIKLLNVWKEGGLDYPTVVRAETLDIFPNAVFHLVASRSEVIGRLHYIQTHRWADALLVEIGTQKFSREPVVLDRAKITNDHIPRFASHGCQEEKVQRLMLFKRFGVGEHGFKPPERRLNFVFILRCESLRLLGEDQPRLQCSHEAVTEVAVRCISRGDNPESACRILNNVVDFFFGGCRPWYLSMGQHGMTRNEIRTNPQRRVIQVCIERDGVHLHPQE